jgi:hypothetical protein
MSNTGVYASSDMERVRAQRPRREAAPGGIEPHSSEIAPWFDRRRLGKRSGLVFDMSGAFGLLGWCPAPASLATS